MGDDALKAHKEECLVTKNRTAQRSSKKIVPNLGLQLSRPLRKCIPRIKKVVLKIVVRAAVNVVGAILRHQ